MTRIRVLLHALDRTGPPMLARALLRALAGEAGAPARSAIDVQVVALRGGPLRKDFEELGTVGVLLRDREGWDHGDPDPVRLSEVRAAVADLPPPDISLLVSVAGGQCLALLDGHPGTVVTWVVEQGEDLHWLDEPVGVLARTDLWLAGNEGSRREVSQRLPVGTPVHLCPEFVEPPCADPREVASIRRRLTGVVDRTVVMGAGIGTWRKAPDLFVEVALAHRRSGHDATFVWIGGEDDPLIPLLRAEVAHLGDPAVVTFVDSVTRLDDWLAAADVFCHTARLDAFPLVCLHAAALGTPVVAFSGAGGVPEMLGESFVGAPYPDVRGLAERVDELSSGGARSTAASAQRARVGRYLSDVAAAAVIDAVLGAAQHDELPAAR
jgi:glycosyltransferase involved in cell wall biosynthesis